MFIRMYTCTAQICGQIMCHWNRGWRKEIMLSSTHKIVPSSSSKLLVVYWNPLFVSGLNTNQKPKPSIWIKCLTNKAVGRLESFVIHEGRKRSVHRYPSTTNPGKQCWMFPTSPVVGLESRSCHLSKRTIKQFDEAPNTQLRNSGSIAVSRTQWVELI